MEKTTIYLPTSVKYELRALARQTTRTEAEIVRTAIAKYVAEESAGRPSPQSWGMYSDGSIDAENYEEFLNEHWKRDW